MGIIGMKVPARGRLLSSWTPPPLESQQHSWEGAVIAATPGTLQMREAMYYALSLPVSTVIIGFKTSSVARGIRQVGDIRMPASHRPPVSREPRNCLPNPGSSSFPTKMVLILDPTDPRNPSRNLPHVQYLADASAQWVSECRTQL
jgi:hypothetical protein